jgi:5'-nucleotidase/UDP-sugar diphosphatase
MPRPPSAFRGMTLAGFALAAASLAVASAPGCSSDAAPTQLQGQVHLTLLHTADIHSRLFPYNVKLGQIDAGLGLGEADAITNVGGIARMSHIVGRERARSQRSLHLDGGDCFQGAPVFNFYYGEAEIRSLSAMGVDAMLIANHEFDAGAKNLAIQLQKWANFPALASNYKLEDPSVPGASPLGTVFEPIHTFDLEGLRVGVLGMANLSSITSIFDAPNRLGITPLNTTEIAQFYIDLLRPDVDVIVAVSHLGLEHDEALIESTTGLDAILGGHNHIVLQPPKQVRDCSEHYDEENESYFITLFGAEAWDPDAGCKTAADCPQPGFCEGTPAAREAGEGVCKVKRFCRPRDVVLAHSGAFAKFVGRLDLVLSNDEKDLGKEYDPLNGYEVLSKSFQLFPVNETVPEDPTVSNVLEPYAQGLDTLANLDLLVGYAPDGSRRASATGGDSPLGNMISTAMWLRLGIQTDFSLTNSTGIRADLVPGPLTVEQMYNVFPFDNSITKMQLSGVEVQQLFDFVARRSAGRGCVSQVQIAGVRVVFDCAARPEGTDPDDPAVAPGLATGVFIGASDVECRDDDDCPGDLFGSCDVPVGRCWLPIEPFGYYELATSNYLAGGGSGFRVLQRNTTQFDTKVQQRDALLEYIQAGVPCGSGSTGELRDCADDGDCGCDDGADPELCDLEEGAYVCACPEGVDESSTCRSNGESCGAGKCVLAACRRDIAAFQRETCADAPNEAIEESCEASVLPCAAAGEQCKFLACVDRRLGNFTDGRIRTVGQ